LGALLREVMRDLGALPSYACGISQRSEAPDFTAVDHPNAGAPDRAARAKGMIVIATLYSS